MAEDTTKLVIQVETLLKGLDKTLAGLAKVEAQLKRVAGFKPSQSTAAVDKATVAAQRLEIQQRKLAVQSQNLTNREEKARQTTERLAATRERAAQRSERARRSEVVATERAIRAQERSIRAQVRAADAERDKERAVRRSNFQRALQQQQQAANRLADTLVKAGNAARSFGQGLSSLGFTLTAAVSAPLAAIGAASLQAAVTLDSLRRGLAAITGSAEKAAVQLRRLEQIAKLPGIGFEEAIQGSIRLQAVGFSAEQAEEALIQFSNAVALTGGGRDELARITVQLGQLVSKGKVLSQDLRPIIEAAPAVGQALKEAFGTVSADDIAELTGSSEEFLRILIDGLTKLPRAAAGARTSLENFRDVVFRAAAAVGDAILPVLTRLIEFIAPAITALAEGFKALPRPLQTVGVIAAGLLAITGPAVILLGGLVTGVGRLAVALGQLGTLGLLPTIANLKLLTASAINATAAITGLQAATIRAVAPWVALAAVLGAVAAAFIFLNDKEEEAAAIDTEAAKSRRERLKQAQEELRFLEGLTTQTSRTVAEEKRLAGAYASLNPVQLARIQFIDSERQKLEQLIAVKREQIRVDEFQVRATTAQLARNVLIELNKQIKAEEQLAEAKRDVADATDESVRRALSRGQIVSQVDRERVAQEFLNDALDRGGKATEDFAKASVEVGKALQVMADTTGLTVDQIVAQVRAAGADERALQLLTKAADDLAQAQITVEAAVSDATKAIVRQNDELERGFTRDPNVIIAKSAERLLRSTLDFIKANTDGINNARKALENYIQLFPVLKQAVEEAGGIDVVIESLFKGGRKRDAGTGLRNAQEQLADALAELTQAQAERQLRINDATNETLLAANEASFRLQLQSYEEYLNTRARLTINALDTEIALQQAALDTELTDFLRLRDAAKQAGIPAQERVRRQAQAAEAQKRATEAETELLELEERRGQIENALIAAQRESALQQVQNIRQLRIEYAELQGNIEDAFRAETLERFRERLEALSREQEFIGERLKLKAISAEERERLRIKREQNQEEIELTENIIRAQNAIAELKAAEQLVINAKEKQVELERELEFQVRFRGLAEEDAIKRRLEGEGQVRNSLELAQAVVEDTIRQLREKFGPDVPVPKALLDFLRDLKAELRGLGELDFVEQFRLAQKEFDRLNEERISRIRDVERAVARRDISELQGRILVKQANGEYVGQLEQQLRLLQQIASTSKDTGLLRQAEDARTTTEDVRNATSEVEDFNKAIQSVSIDALHDSFAGFLDSLRHGADAAKEALLDMLDSVLSRVNQIIADRIFEKLFGSFLQPETPVAAGGEVGGLGGSAIAGLLGIGGGAQTTQANTVATDANTAAINALTATLGGQAGGVGLGGGINPLGIVQQIGGFFGGIFGNLFGLGKEAQEAGTEGKAEVEGIPDLEAGLTRQGGTILDALDVIIGLLNDILNSLSGSAALGGDIASSVSDFASLFGGAATGLYPAVPGGVYKVVEGGYPEAVLTTDPKHATRQLAILREYLRQTKGLFGRVPQLAEGAIVSTSEVEAGFLRSLSPQLSTPSPSSDLQLQSAATAVSLRNINLFDRREVVSSYLRSAEGTRDILNVVSLEGPEIGRRIGVRG